MRRLLVLGCLLVAGVVAAPAAPAAGLSTAAEPAGTERYIVQFTRGTDSQAGARELRGHGGQVDRVLSRVFSGAVVRLPARAAAALARNPRVASIEVDRVATTSETQPSAPWGLDRSDQRLLPLSGSYTWGAAGTGVTSYVVDTGIRGDHVDFGGRVAAGYTAVADGEGTGDCHGHGTHVAGTVGGATYGVAKDTRLVPVRVLGCDGSGSYSQVLAGLEWVVGDHAAGEPAVLNMSLGGPASEAIDAAVQAAVDDGVTVVVAAGNSDADACGHSPARAGAALTVGATDRTDTRAWFSNYGSCLDLFAPGVHIASTWHSAATATATLHGTSMAAPHVAGAAAAVLEADPTLSPGQVTARLLGTATTGTLAQAGPGSPDRLLWADPALGAPAPAEPPETPETAFRRGTVKASTVLATRARFNYSSTVPGSTFRCTLDGSRIRCGDSSVTLSGLRKTTHRFTVAARGPDGGLDRSPAVRVWTVPRNNAALWHGRGWTKVRARGHYLNSYSTARKPGVTLRTRAVNTRRLALVAATGPRHGKVRVYFGGKLLKRVSLASPTATKKRVIPVARFAGARRSGKVRIVVASAGKPVRIEGLAIATR